VLFLILNRGGVFSLWIFRLIRNHFFTPATYLSHPPTPSLSFIIIIIIIIIIKGKRKGGEGEHNHTTQKRGAGRRVAGGFQLPTKKIVKNNNKGLLLYFIEKRGRELKITRFLAIRLNSCKDREKDGVNLKKT
jgi:hypothetical protein